MSVHLLILYISPILLDAAINVGTKIRPFFIFNCKKKKTIEHERSTNPSILHGDSY